MIRGSTLHRAGMVLGNLLRGSVLGVLLAVAVIALLGYSEDAQIFRYAGY